MKEDQIIKQSLKVRKVSETNGNIVSEYPTYQDLSKSYTEKNCNNQMAKAASLSLRRKLSKSGKLEDFHAKVKVK